MAYLVKKTFAAEKKVELGSAAHSADNDQLSCKLSEQACKNQSLKLQLTHWVTDRSEV